MSSNTFSTGCLNKECDVEKYSGEMLNFLIKIVFCFVIKKKKIKVKLKQIKCLIF